MSYEDMDATETPEPTGETAPEVTPEPEPAPVETPEAATAEEVEQTPEQIEEHKRKTGSQREREKNRALQRQMAEMQAELARLRQTVAPVAQPDGPQMDQFADLDSYLDARERHRDEKRKQAQLAETWAKKEQDARAKYEDFEESFDGFVASGPSRELVATVIESPLGPEVARYLGANPQELERIKTLPAMRQAAEIGKIEAKLTEPPKTQPRTTKAPPPIAPIVSSGVAAAKTHPSRFEEF